MRLDLLFHETVPSCKTVSPCQPEVSLKLCFVAQRELGRESKKACSFFPQRIKIWKCKLKYSVYVFYEIHTSFFKLKSLVPILT